MALKWLFFEKLKKIAQQLVELLVPPVRSAISLNETFSKSFFFNLSLSPISAKFFLRPYQSIICDQVYCITYFRSWYFTAPSNFHDVYDNYNWTVSN